MRIVENLQLDIALAQSGIRAKGQAMATAVHLHLYYMEQLAGLLEDIGNLGKAGEKYDLYVTIARAAPQLEAEKAIRALKADAEIWYPENRGYDIGAFVDFLHRINLGNYDYVLKLHTKNRRRDNYTILNGNRMDNALWGSVLRDGLLSTLARAKANLEYLAAHPQAGMLGSKYCLTGEKHAYVSLLPQIREIMAEMEMPLPVGIKFIAGSMFIARAALLKPFLRYTLSDFAPTDGRIKEGTFAHAMERAFGAAIIGQGYQIKGIAHGSYGIKFAAAALRRFLFQTKITGSGKKIVKICKIPVYSKQLNHEV